MRTEYRYWEPLAEDVVHQHLVALYAARDRAVRWAAWARIRAIVTSLMCLMGLFNQIVYYVSDDHGWLWLGLGWAVAQMVITAGIWRWPPRFLR